MTGLSRPIIGVALALSLVAGACGADGAVTAGRPSPSATPGTVAPTVPAPTPTPNPASEAVDLPEPVLPAVRPADFVATYAEDGGMAPWYERTEVRNDGATYLVWMDGLELRFEHTPAARRIDELYEELRLGRFELYEVIPFGEDEMIYDHETTSWRVRAGDYDHRLSAAGEDIVSPSTGHFPLRALSRFVDDTWVPSGGDRATIRAGDGDFWDVSVTFELGDADFAMGDERWADEIGFAWVGGPIEVAVTVTTGEDTDTPTTASFTVVLERGAVIDLTRDAEGNVTVSNAGV